MISLSQMIFVVMVHRVANFANVPNTECMNLVHHSMPKQLLMCNRQFVMHMKESGRGGSRIPCKSRQPARDAHLNLSDCLISEEGVGIQQIIAQKPSSVQEKQQVVYI